MEDEAQKLETEVSFFSFLSLSSQNTPPINRQQQHTRQSPRPSHSDNELPVLSAQAPPHSPARAPQRKGSLSLVFRRRALSPASLSLPLVVATHAFRNRSRRPSARSAPPFPSRAGGVVLSLAPAAPVPPPLPRARVARSVDARQTPQKKHLEQKATMTEAWRSNPMHWCEVCKCWMADNRASRLHHERGARHLGNLQQRESLECGRAALPPMP